jgi:hypothetical protein
VAFWAAVVVVLAPVAYPLSAGPASWAFEHGLASEAVVGTVYAPRATAETCLFSSAQGLRPGQH